MSERRRQERLFDYVVLATLAGVFVAVLEVMSRANIKPEVLTVLGASLGVDLGAIVMAASHLWGAPKRQAEAGPGETRLTVATAPPAEPETGVKQ